MSALKDWAIAEGAVASSPVANGKGERAQRLASRLRIAWDATVGEKGEWAYPLVGRRRLRRFLPHNGYCG